MKEEELRRGIGRLGYSAIALNGVIGAGIFGLPAVAVARSGDFSPWLFLICGALILTIVLSFARAASFFRSTGGPIAYADLAFGPFVGFQAGWLGYLSRVAAMGANANLLVTYAAWFWPGLDDGITRSISITLILVGLTTLNIIGVRSGMAAIFVFTFFKLVPLSLLVLLGLGQVSPGLMLGAQPPAFHTLGETILVVLYAFVGFEGAVIPAGEGRKPHRDIPRALFLTVLGITAFYFLIQWVSISVMPDLGSSRTPLADVAGILMGPVGATLLTVGAVFSIGGNLSASLLGAPRMTYVMALDGRLPAWLAKVHPHYQVPINSVLFYGALSLALALTGTFIWLAVMSTLVRLLMYSIAIASLPRLEKHGEKHDGQFTVPGGYTIPLIALLLCGWLVTHASMHAWLTTAVFFLIGSALYAWERRKRR